MSIPIPAGTLALPPAVSAPAEPAAPAAVRHRRGSLRSRLPVLLVALVLLLVAAGLVWRQFHKPVVAEVVATDTVALHDISQSVDATGTVEAIEVVEIKSKASGEILKMPIAIGSVVKAGDLLAQIDPLTVRNQYNQLLAALKAAQANVTITAASRARADELYSREAMTAADHESAQLGAANAQASLAKASADLQIARQALDDATVRAPSAGTIVEQTATRGMVITSATSSASGGTTLFKMADLDRIQIQTMVGETDVGGLQPGMTARVTVDAFPDHTFRGTVLKIEPQAVVQQSVTMFPVLVSIANENGRLLPGMNGEVTIDIARRDQVVAVPLDAVRSLRELPSVAATLGLDVNTLRAQVQQQTGTTSAAPAARTDTAHAAAGTARATRSGGRTRTRTRTGSAAGSVTASPAQIVMVQTPAGFEARVVHIGISDFDYAEILSGLRAGEVVALLSVAEQAAKRKSTQTEMAKRVGGAMTGTSSGGARGTGGGH